MVARPEETALYRGGPQDPGAVPLGSLGGGQRPSSGVTRVEQSPGGVLWHVDAGWQVFCIPVRTQRPDGSLGDTRRRRPVSKGQSRADTVDQWAAELHGAGSKQG